MVGLRWKSDEVEWEFDDGKCEMPVWRWDQAGPLSNFVHQVLRVVPDKGEGRRGLQGRRHWEGACSGPKVLEMGQPVVQNVTPARNLFDLSHLLLDPCSFRPPSLAANDVEAVTADVLPLRPSPPPPPLHSFRPPSLAGDVVKAVTANVLPRQQRHMLGVHALEVEHNVMPATLQGQAHLFAITLHCEQRVSNRPSLTPSGLVCPFPHFPPTLSHQDRGGVSASASKWM